jgi:hypothetical protein
MDYRKFETDLAKKLHDASHPVDIDALISGLHPQDRKRRRIFPIMLASFVMVGLGAWWTIVPQNNQNLVDASAAHTNLEKVTSEIATPILLDRESTNTTSPQENNTSTSIKPLTNDQTSDINKSSTTSNRKEIIKETISLSQENFNKTFSKAAALIQEQNVSSQNELTTSREKFTSGFNETKFSTNSGSSMFLSNSLEQNSSHRPSLELIDKYTYNNLLQIESLPYSVSRLSTYKPRKIKKMTKVICPPFKQRNNAIIFALVPEVGTYYPIKSLAAINKDQTEIFQKRETYEHSLEGLAASLSLRAQREDFPFYAQIGGSLHRHTERMRINYEYRTKDTIEGIISITESQNGDTLTIIKGDIIREKKISGSKTIHHAFSMIDIPLGIGYKKNVGFLDVGFEAGILANIKTQNSGRLFNGDTTFLATDDLPAETFRPVLGLQYYAGLAAYYPLGKHGEIFATTRYRYIPKSFTGDKAAIGQRYQFAGLYLGYVRYL